MSEPEWAEECRRCKHLRISQKGRIWKCDANRLHGRGFQRRYVADVRLERLCKFEANNAVRGAAEPRTLDGLVGHSESEKGA